MTEPRTDWTRKKIAALFDLPFTELVYRAAEIHRQADRLNEKMLMLEKRQKELKKFLETAKEPEPLLHPEMATFYRERVRELYAALKSEPKQPQTEVTEVLRSLISQVILTPQDGELQIDVRGELAGILNLSLKRKKPAEMAGNSQVSMVAGVGFEPTTFRL